MKQFSGLTILIIAICRSRGTGVLAAFGLLLVIPVVIAAQITTATIVGTTADPSGEAVPGAKVTARNVDTGLTRTVNSGEDGAYRIEFLPVGNYTIEVVAT